MHSALTSHLNCALNVLRYLKGAPGNGIRYIHSEYKNNLSGYSDVDWAKCLKTRKSVTGYCEEHPRCCQAKGLKFEERLVHLMMVVKFEVLIAKKQMCFPLGLKWLDKWMEVFDGHLEEFEMKKCCEEKMRIDFDEVCVVEENGRIHEDKKLKRRNKLKIKISRHLSTVLAITGAYELGLS
ncbi:hypothetical protein Tco_0644836 [Tanacetum coccineum]